MFWQKAGTYYLSGDPPGYDRSFNRITLSNYQNDRQQDEDVPSAPMVEAIACAIALAVAMNPLIGRIRLVDIFILAEFGAAFYEVNSQIMWRWFVTDNAFGIRILIFGSVMGLVASLLLGKKE